MAAVSSAGTSYIKLTSSNQLVKAGENFSVVVLAYATTPVNAVNVAIEFPEDLVEVLGVDRGESVITLWTEDPEVVNGTVTLSGGTYRKGFIGEHRLATINLRAKTTGQASILASKIELLAGDGKGTPVQTNLSFGKLNLKIIGVVPDKLDAKAVLAIVTDINSDGKVGLDDISSFMAAWASKNQNYDFNKDGVMTFKDFSILLSEYFSA